MNLKTLVLSASVCAAAATLGGTPLANSAANLGSRYQSEAFRSFDNDDVNIKPEVKEPKWFSFLTGPHEETAEAQFAWCEACEQEGSTGSARRGYDALVREWPTSPSAPKAQLRLAELELADEDYEDAFASYRYLLDFYSSACDYEAVAKKMYEVAEKLREAGKRVFFVRFSNTADVRRAYESLVLRAPGADFVPKALLTIAALREDEKKLDLAVSVYESLRNLYSDTPEAVQALESEARVRMELLRQHGYNRSRVQDTADFLRQALRGTIPDDVRAKLEAWLRETSGQVEEDAWGAAHFYDSRTRTRRSAIGAYETYLQNYPDGTHADEARARLQELKGETK